MDKYCCLTGKNPIFRAHFRYQMSATLKLKPWVFFPPVVILVMTLAFGVTYSDPFLRLAERTKDGMLNQFGWLFSWSAFAFLILLGTAYVLPFGRTKIGGKAAVPILSKWRWFAITLCTTVATGILFWGMAEPLHHLHRPPPALAIESGSSLAAVFSLATLHLHWSFTPYGVYTLAGLVFALSYYNLHQPFSLTASLAPISTKLAGNRLGKLIDVICLYALVLGMSASLGTGMFAITGGLDLLMGWTKSALLLAMIGFSIVFSFVFSAVSGLHRGIAILSDVNVKAFFGLAVFVLITGPTLDILSLGWESVQDYAVNFFPRSVNFGDRVDREWEQDWTLFYLANWYAWAPVAALFLGRIAVGYTVRDFILFNLVFPSLFTIIWMSIFGGTSLTFDMQEGQSLFETMELKGEEIVMFQVLGSLPFGRVISLATLVMVFISYVTAADSNVSAMSAISTHGISPNQPEAPLWVKLVWGSIIGITAWLMVSTAGIEGIRILSVMGGFPALFLVIVVAVGLVKMILTSGARRSDEEQPF